MVIKMSDLLNLIGDSVGEAVSGNSLPPCERSKPFWEELVVESESCDLPFDESRAEPTEVRKPPTLVRIAPNADRPRAGRSIGRQHAISATLVSMTVQKRPAAVIPHRPVSHIAFEDQALEDPGHTNMSYGGIPITVNFSRAPMGFSEMV